MENDISQRISRVTLRIDSPNLEEAYRNASIGDGLVQFRYAFLIGLLFYLSFIALDYWVFSEVAASFTIIRLGLVVPTIVIGFICTFFDFYKRYARVINLFVLMVCGIGAILMEIFGAGASNIHLLYASMMLILMYLYAFFKMPFLDALFVGTALIGGYLFLEFSLVQPPLAIITIHSFNLIAANVLGASVAYVMELQSKKEFLLKKRLSESVIKDALTGLYNRHYFEQFLVPDIEGFIYRSKGVKHIERRLGDMNTAKYGLFMLDIDFFKRVNDTFGHHSGDLVLQQFAKVLQDNVRRTDDVLRVGGEEFLLVLKLTTEDYLIKFAKKIGNAVAEHDFKVENGGIIGCTVSIGLIVLPDSRTDDVNELISYADRALYRSKDQGRNRGHRVYELQGEMEFEEILWDE